METFMSHSKIHAWKNFTSANISHPHSIHDMTFVQTPTPTKPNPHPTQIQLELCPPEVVLPFPELQPLLRIILPNFTKLSFNISGVGLECKLATGQDGLVTFTICFGRLSFLSVLNVIFMQLQTTMAFYRSRSGGNFKC